MKKVFSIISIFGLAIITLSCDKGLSEKDIQVNDQVDENYVPASFGAYVAGSEAELTKTTYLSETTFNWVGDEVVSVNLITNSTNQENQRYDFYAEVDESDRATATFYAADKQGSEALSLGEGGTYSLGHYAFYPGQSSATLQNGKVLSFNIGTVIKTSAGASNVKISDTFKHSVAHPMRVIPLIGEKDDTGNFSFHAATGILKITVSNIDERLAKVQLYAPGQKITGTFGISTVDEKTCYVMGESTAESENKMTLALTDRNSETELPFYFPVPVGTLNAGFKINLLDANDNILRTATCKSNISIARNCISEMTKAIPLPDEDFSATITAGGKSNAPEATVNITKDATSVKVVAAASEAAGLALIEANNAAVVSFGNGETKSLDIANIAKSGTNYIVAQTYQNDAAKLSYSIPVYLITVADAEAICSQYVRDVTVGNTTLEATTLYGDNTITIAVSDDPTKGNIMITEFAGFTNKVSNHTFTTWSRDWANFQDGNPVYGLYGDSIVYGGKTGAEFYNVQNQIFYTDSSNSKHIIGTEQSSLTTLQFAFSSDGYTTGVVHDLVVWNPYIGNNYNASLTSPDFYFNKYVANKTKGKISLTASMLSTNTSYGEGGSGDAGGMAALVDKNGSTYWHTNYGVSVNTDEHGAYIQIDLTSLSKTVNKFTVKFLTRAEITHGLPTKYRFAGSKNGTDWSFISEETTISAASAKWFQKDVNAGDDYSYIRLCITESDKGSLTTTADGNYYTHMAEIQLWEN